MTSENNNNNQPTTNYEANRQNNDNPDDDSKEQHPTTDTSNEQPAGKSSTTTGTEIPSTKKEKQTQTKVITNENETEVQKTADTTQCIQIVSQLGVTDPAKAEQVCQLLMQSFVDSYNTPPANKSMGSPQPPQSGQIGSVDEANKIIAKHVATIEKLQDDLRLSKKSDKSDTQRIAELEEQIKTFEWYT